MKNITILLVGLLFITSCSLLKSNKNTNQKVRLETTEGNITVMLYKDVPQHSANFIKLVQEGFYDSLLFHRIIPGFMIQGGDPNSKGAAPSVALGNGDVGYKTPAELNFPKYFHKKGALAMAQDGNRELASSGCQFYIVEGKKLQEAALKNLERKKKIIYTEEQRKVYRTVGGTPHLDSLYTVFGEVIEGLDIVTKISSQATMAQNRPVKDVMIIRATLIK